MMHFDIPSFIEEDSAFLSGEMLREEEAETSIFWNEGVDAWFASREKTPQTLPELVTTMKIYIASNHWDKIESIWNSCFGGENEANFQADHLAYSLLLCAYAHTQGRSLQAQQIFNTMINEKMEPDAGDWAHLIQSTIRDGLVSKGLQLFEEAKEKGLKWKLTQIRELMVALFQAPTNAEKFVSMVEPLIEKHSQPYVPGGAHSQRGFERAQVTAKMEMFGFAIMKSFWKKDITSANAYAEKVLENKGATLYVGTVAHMARWYIRKGQLQEARNFINYAVLQLQNPSRTQQQEMMPPRISVLLLELTFRSTSDKREATQLILSQFYALFDAYQSHNALALTRYILYMLSSFKRWDEVFEVTDYAQKKLGNISASLTSLYNHRMKAYVALGEKDRALEILNQMQGTKLHKPNQQTMVVIISMETQLNGAEHGFAFLQAIIDTVGAAPPAAAFHAVIRGFAKEKRLDQALKTIQLMETHGLQVHWDTYGPLFSLFERMDLLGKQFKLYLQLLHGPLKDHVPSPKWTASLIFACIKNRFLTVGHHVAQLVESRQIPIQLSVLIALVELAQQAGNSDELLKLASISTARLDADEAPPIRTHFGITSIRILSHLQRPDDAALVLKKMRKLKLPLNLTVMHALLSCYLRNGRIENAQKLYAVRSKIFGPQAEKAAESNAFTMSLVMQLTEKYSDVKTIWAGIVAESRRWKTMQDARTKENDDSSVAVVKDIPISGFQMDSAEGLTSKTLDLESLEEAQMIANEANTLEEEVNEVVGEHEEVENAVSFSSSDSPRFPKLNSLLASVMLKLTLAHARSEPSYVQSVVMDIQQLGLPKTALGYLVLGKSFVFTARARRLLELFDDMVKHGIPMTHYFFHSLLEEAADLGELTKRKNVAVTIFDWMSKNALSDLIVGPNESTWRLFLSCMPSEHIGQYLYLYTKAGYKVNEQLLHCLVRHLILHQRPFDAAINDTFCLIAISMRQYNVSPSTMTLNLLKTAVTRSGVEIESAWALHFCRLIFRLHRRDRLAWNAEELKRANKVLRATQRRRAELTLHSQQKSQTPPPNIEAILTSNATESDIDTLNNVNKKMVDDTPESTEHLNPIENHELPNNGSSSAFSEIPETPISLSSSSSTSYPPGHRTNRKIRRTPTLPIDVRIGPDSLSKWRLVKELVVIYNILALQVYPDIPQHKT
jgi:pentatricopeptide repeat protein